MGYKVTLNTVGKGEKKLLRVRGKRTEGLKITEVELKQKYNRLRIIDSDYFVSVIT